MVPHLRCHHKVDCKFPNLRASITNLNDAFENLTTLELKKSLLNITHEIFFSGWKSNLWVDFSLNLTKNHAGKIYMVFHRYCIMNLIMFSIQYKLAYLLIKLTT